MQNWTFMLLFTSIFFYKSKRKTKRKTNAIILAYRSISNRCPFYRAHHSHQPSLAQPSSVQAFLLHHLVNWLQFSSFSKLNFTFNEFSSFEFMQWLFFGRRDFNKNNWSDIEANLCIHDWIRIANRYLFVQNVYSPIANNVRIKTLM